MKNLTSSRGVLLAAMAILVLLLHVAVLSHASHAQVMRVAILGSSTAEGTGPQNPANAWAKRYEAYLASSGISYQVINLAYGGYTTFAILPTGYVSPYRNQWDLPVDQDRNITKALSYNPTHIIINLPSNDEAMGFPNANQIEHYDVVVAEAQKHNVPVWITTSQPRNDSQSVRDLLIGMRDATNSHYGSYAVDFWTGIANADGTIRTEYNVDGMHVNDAAHEILYERVKAKIPASNVTTLPTITTEPSNQTVQEGAAATFSLTATGTAPLSYQWQKNNGNISGATSNSYTTPATTLADNGATFRCIVSNAQGRDTSTTVTLTVTSASQVDVLANGGFESGTSPWAFYSNGSATFSAVSPGHVGDKAAKIQVASAGSNVQLYQVNFPLEANTQYTLRFDASSNTGHDVALYLHQHNSPWTDYGVNNWVVDLQQGWNTYTLTFTTKGFAGTITDTRLRFWFSPYATSGDVYTIDAVALSKGSGSSPVAPAVTSDPTPQTVQVGQMASFSITATGTEPLSYQWQRNGTEIAGATSRTYTTPATTMADSGATFRCVVSNAAGKATSAAALLRVTPAPTTAATITGDPKSQTVQQGETATFSVSATGTAPLAYQWQKNGANIAGGTATTYTTPATILADNATKFRCIVSNGSGRDTSAEATLSVTSTTASVLLNGGFEEGTQSWTFSTDGAASFTSSSPGFSGSRAARIQITRPGSNVQLYQLNFPLEANTQYTLRFTANCNTGHDVALYLQKNALFATNYGINNWVADLQSGWNTYSRNFTTQGFTGTTTGARLRFWFAPYDAAGDIYTIDDVVLYKSSSTAALAREGQEIDAVQADLLPAPTSYGLMENYPNPFNPKTVVGFALPVVSDVRLGVYDLLGREVAVLVNERKEPGTYQVTFNPSGLASGVYIYRLTAEGTSGVTYVSTKRMMLLK